MSTFKTNLHQISTFFHQNSLIATAHFLKDLRHVQTQQTQFQTFDWLAVLGVKIVTTKKYKKRLLKTLQTNPNQSYAYQNALHNLTILDGQVPTEHEYLIDTLTFKIIDRTTFKHRLKTSYHLSDYDLSELLSTSIAQQLRLNPTTVPFDALNHLTNTTLTIFNLRHAQFTYNQLIHELHHDFNHQFEQWIDNDGDTNAIHLDSKKVKQLQTLRPIVNEHKTTIVYGDSYQPVKPHDVSLNCQLLQGLALAEQQVALKNNA